MYVPCILVGTQKGLPKQSRDSFRRIVGFLTGLLGLLGKHSKYFALVTIDECRFCDDHCVTDRK